MHGLSVVKWVQDSNPRLQVVNATSNYPNIQHFNRIINTNIVFKGIIAYIPCMENKQYILDNFDLDGLLEIGFIKDKNDFEAIEKRICKFFHLKRVTDYSYILPNKKSVKYVNPKKFEVEFLN